MFFNLVLFHGSTTAVASKKNHSEKFEILNCQRTFQTHVGIKSIVIPDPLTTS